MPDGYYIDSKGRTGLIVDASGMTGCLFFVWPIFIVCGFIMAVYGSSLVTIFGAMLGLNLSLLFSSYVCDIGKTLEIQMWKRISKKQLRGFSLRISKRLATKGKYKEAQAVLHKWRKAGGVQLQLKKLKDKQAKFSLRRYFNVLGICLGTVLSFMLVLDANIGTRFSAWIVLAYVGFVSFALRRHWQRLQLVETALKQGLEAKDKQIRQLRDKKAYESIAYILYVTKHEKADMLLKRLPYSAPQGLGAFFQNPRVLKPLLMTTELLVFAALVLSLIYWKP